MYYSSEIFSDAGIHDGDVATAVMGVVLVIGTIATVCMQILIGYVKSHDTFQIILIERIGRRTLMLYGLGGMTIFFALVSTAFCFQFSFYGLDTRKVSQVLE